MLSTKINLLLITSVLPAIMYGGHLGIEATKSKYDAWRDAQIEQLLHRKLQTLQIEIGVDKNGNPKFESAANLSCSDWQSAALLYKLQLESRRTSIESIKEYVQTYLEEEK